MCQGISEALHILVKWFGVQIWYVYPVHRLEGKKLKLSVIVDGGKDHKREVNPVVWTTEQSSPPAIFST